MTDPAPPVRPLRLLLLALPLLLLAGCGGCGDPNAPDALAESEPEALARLAVVADSSADREVFLADGRGTYYYDALADPQRNPAMGLVAGGFRVLDGWRWGFPADLDGDGEPDSTGLGPADIVEGVARPDFVARSYAEADTSGFLGGLVRRFQGPDLKELTEVVTLGDGALVVSVPDSVGTLDFLPALSDRRADGYQTEARGNTLLVARTDYTAPRGTSRRPVWLAVAAEGGEARTRGVDLAERYPRDLGARDRALAPGAVRFESPGTVALATGMTPEAAAAAAEAALRSAGSTLERRQRRLAAVVEDVGIETEDEDFDRAFRWARLTLEELVVEDTSGFEIATGIPGAQAQPGWNMLQTLRGAFLATGEWERAADLLKRYAGSQRFDRRIDIFGRAPSRFENGRPVYETADAQAVLVAALGDYLRTTGDNDLVLGNRTLFWRNPVYVQRGYEDRNQLRAASGLVRAPENQTWVQVPEGRRRERARGPEPVEVQARYLANLRTMQRLARIMGVSAQSRAYADSARAFGARVERAFLADDRGGPVLADAVGRPNPTLRPSGLLALDGLNLDPETERAVVRRLAEALAYPHGVSTRPQTDSTFYPFLTEPEFYSPAEARYEGAVWTALSGPLVSALVDAGAPDRAYEQTEALIRQLLDRGVVGAISENLDAHPRPTAEGDEALPDPGGAPVQPYTLAEFVRNAYEDYAGVRYRAGNDVVLAPHLPESWGETAITFRVGGGSVRAVMAQGDGRLEAALTPQGDLPRGATVRVRAFGQEVRVPVSQPQGDTLTVAAEPTTVVLTAGGAERDGESVRSDSTFTPPDPAFWEGFAWAEPEVQDEYPVMRAVRAERRLTPEQVTRRSPMAVPILSRTDPEGDDWGTTATYTYPVGFPESVLDAVYFEVAEDDSATYFRIELAALADRSALGFQPTFAAIAFDSEEGGERDVERGAGYRFPTADAYEYIAYVGDGLRVEDKRGRVLGEFDRLGDAIADVSEGSLQFSLPKFVLPELPRGTLVTLMIGANEGGALGAFRPVLEDEATEAAGGEKVNEGDPNIYDIVTGRVE